MNKKKMLALESIKDAVEVHDKQHKKAEEMIDLMRIIKADALRRKRQYQKMVKGTKAIVYRGICEIDNVQPTEIEKITELVETFLENNNWENSFKKK